MNPLIASKSINIVSLAVIYLTLRGQISEAEALKQLASELEISVQDLVLLISGTLAAITEPIFRIGSIFKRVRSLFTSEK
jgi:hypothetical protein